MSEKCFLLYDSSCHVNVHKRNHSIAIPKSNCYKKCKNQTKTKPELKLWKSSTLLHNVKRTQEVASSAKLSYVHHHHRKEVISTLFLPPSKKRGSLKWDISKGQITTNNKKAAFLLILFAILFQTCIGKAKINHQHYLNNQHYWGWSEGPPSSKGQYKWYHRRLCPSGKWCSSLNRIFVLKKSK